MSNLRIAKKVFAKVVPEAMEQLGYSQFNTYCFYKRSQQLTYFFNFVFNSGAEGFYLSYYVRHNSSRGPLTAGYVGGRLHQCQESGFDWWVGPEAEQESLFVVFMSMLKNVPLVVENYFSNIDCTESYIVELVAEPNFQDRDTYLELAIALTEVNRINGALLWCDVSETKLTMNDVDEEFCLSELKLVKQLKSALISKEAQRLLGTWSEENLDRLVTT